MLAVEDHEAESEGGASHAISGNVIEGVVIDQECEQEELFCRVCDPVDEDIEDGAEEETGCSGRCATPACPRGEKSSSTT